MRAALIREVGGAPEVGEVAEPAGESVEVLAAPINPIDLAVSRGILATGHPDLPYVPGCEAVGRTDDGRVVWIFGGSLGRTSPTARSPSARRSGTRMRSTCPRARIPRSPRRSGSPASPAGCRSRGARRFAGGENVLVLGATGSVGLVAVQTAKLLGAARVVAAGRSAAGLERARECGADATAPPRRGRRSRGGIQGRVRRRGPELRLRPAVGRARRSGRPGCSAARHHRQSRPVGRRERGARLGCGALQEPLDPRSHELRRPRWTSSPSTTGGSSATRSRARSGSTWSACRSTRSPTRGDVRRRAPERSSSSSRNGSVFGTRRFGRGCDGYSGRHATHLLAAGLARLQVRPPHPGAPHAAQGAEVSRGGDDRVDVRQLAAEQPRSLDRLAVANQKRRADGDVAHAQRLERDVERADRIAVPVREERDVDAERLRPRAVRPGRVARDRERPDACGGEVVAPVTQEQQLVRSGRRPVVEVEAEERPALAEHLAQRPRLLAGGCPHLDVGNASAGVEHAHTLRGLTERPRLVQCPLRADARRNAKGAEMHATMRYYPGNTEIADQLAGRRTRFDP